VSSNEFVSFGIDLGTTNTVFARASADGSKEIVCLDSNQRDRSVYPTVLAFEQDYEGDRSVCVVKSGEEAIHLASRYPNDFRYLQSFKSHVASPSFNKTTIFGQNFGIPDLLSLFVENSGIVDAIASHKGPKQVVVGRPVRFHGENPDDDLAVDRYRTGFAAVGIKGFDLVLEPVAGAFSYFSTLNSPIRALVADFGGGTSDFLVAEFNPSKSGTTSRALSHAGLGIAGDTFDYRIIQNALLKYFGANTSYSVDEKSLPVPRYFFSALSRWHDLIRLRTTQNLKTLNEIRRSSDMPELIDNLIYVITHNKGLEISKAVASVKAKLSSSLEADLEIVIRGTKVRETLTRKNFEQWIVEDLRRISDTVEDVIQRSGLSGDMIDRVFLTGGSSLIPAIQAIFMNRFGCKKVVTGESFSAVAEGLSLIGLNDK